MRFVYVQWDNEQYSIIIKNKNALNFQKFAQPSLPLVYESISRAAITLSERGREK